MNVFVDKVSAKKFAEASLSDALFSWMEERHLDGVNFEFHPDAFLGDLDAAKHTVSFFSNVKKDWRWGNLTLAAMLPYTATLLFKEELASRLDVLFIHTHGLLDEQSGRIDSCESVVHR